MAKTDKLAQDVSKAIAAGLSYGQWMAKQEKTPPRPEKGLRVCKYCGKTFKPKNAAQKYCDSNCQYLARLERQRKEK